PDLLPEVSRLVETYGLERWQEVSGRVDFAASLFYLQMIERAFTEAAVRLPEGLSALDAGCGDWFYVQALYGLLRRFRGERQVCLTGVEVDAYRPYAGLRSRIDWAHAYMDGLKDMRYLPVDIRQFTEPVDVAFQLFPFLFGDDLRRWGLPRRYLTPDALLRHVAGLVKPGGVLVTANLGEAERDAQHRLLQAAGLNPVWWGRHESPLFTYRQPRFVTVVRKACEPGEE
ncbi:MAG TPA: hypothetical protein VNT75_32755, partial [Symbiobacteriaceae bacterium]|nr:hypothetical protein [Symbiobacteriaceae bacterium]